jgi:BirA family biotin operon repressor/biotin-[acetyl-CoA-carboxylase] ligase
MNKLSSLACNLIYLDSCGSTNTVASKLLEAGYHKDDTIIITNNQTHGKGQRNTEWQTEPNSNLTFSIIKFPDFLVPNRGFYLNFIASLAVYNALKEYNLPQMKVKWPNDIYCGSKKLCGILIESKVIGKTVLSSIIGIGINVNQKLFKYDTATSISLVYGLDVSIEDLALGVIKNFNALYKQLRTGCFDFIRNQYLSNLYWLYETRTFDCEGVIFQGAIVDIDANGELVVRHSNGILHSYGYKKIKFLY